ncbi:fibronectin type-III domain-containing transmembrane protein C1orf233 homolog [Sinocyclocheilus grahami]|uniref:Fibronectin type III domain containing 10 n=1 Tax=Sinocyclocheilus grahami TaxID=75366 RepID=A0A672M3I4_SINGR|nr:PREDICTED: fibronectin type-III domain-containing transmembrane protein C1orf233 homolog [Sinocyclocheilus grahami]
MVRRQGPVLPVLLVLLVLSGGSSALPDRASADAQHDTTDSNNTNKYTNQDSLGTTERLPKLQDNSSAVRRWRVLGDPGPLCAYRTLDAGDPGPLCFRYAQTHFRCASASCRQVSSPGGQLTANILSNGSVFIQWTVAHEAPPKGPAPHQPGGFRLSCWWNGSYTQFECAGVHLGAGCRDYLLNELHTNVPYRLCVRPYDLERDEACVEFSLAPGGMQDIVIAMTTVGGAICVMLVIICLLVAYITENIMNPTAQHTLAAQHSHRSHLHTHL